MEDLLQKSLSPIPVLNWVLAYSFLPDVVSWGWCKGAHPARV